MKDWLNHKDTNLHFYCCRLLRARFPKWDGQIKLSALDIDVTRSSSTSAKKTRRETSSHSHDSACGRDTSSRRSRSGSPRRHRDLAHGRDSSTSRSRSRSHHRDWDRRRERRRSHSRSRSPRRSYRPARRERWRARSPSPHSSRRNRRSRSHSSSPHYYRPTSSRRRSRSRSYNRDYSPRRRDEKHYSRDRRLSPRRNNDKYSSERSREGRSAEKSSSRRKRSGSAERVVKNVLETSADQSLFKECDLQAVVKALAPVLLAELAKMQSTSKPSSSSSPSSHKPEEKSSTESSTADSQICIKMSESSGVTQVVKTILSQDDASPHESCVKSIKQPLQESADITISFGPETKDGVPPAETCAPQPPLSESPANATEAAVCDVEMKETCDKPETGISTDSTVTPQPNEAEMGKESLPTTSTKAADGNESSTHSASSVVKSRENDKEVCHTDETITETIKEHQLTQSEEQIKEKEICIEMSESSGVTQVVETILSQDYVSPHESCVKSLKRHLQDSADITISFGPETKDNVPPAETCAPQPPPSDSPANATEPAVCDVEIKETRDKPETGISTDYTIALQPNEAGDEAEMGKESLPTTSTKAVDGNESSIHSTSSVVKSREDDELLHTDETITETIQGHELAQKSEEQTDEKEDQDVCSNDAAPSKTLCSDESSSNFQESVTVNEIIKDVADENLEDQSSSLSEQTSRRTTKNSTQPSQSVVVKSVHEVSVKSIPAETVESETKIETLEMHPPAQEQESELDSQLQKVKKKSTDDGPRELKKEGDMEDAGNPSEEEEVDGKHVQILVSNEEQVVEQMDEDGKSNGSEIQVPGSEQSQKLQEDACQLKDSVEDQAKACPEECSEMELDSSVPVQDNVAEDQAVSTIKPVTKENETVETDTSMKSVYEDLAEANKALDTSSSQTQSGEESSKDLNKIVQITNVKDQVAVQDEGNKDTPTDDNQETFEILDTIDDQSGTQQDSQKTETLSDEIPKEDLKPEEKKQEAFQLIDSAEDQPTTIEIEPDDDHREKGYKRDDAPSKRVTRSTPRTREVKGEEAKPSKTEDQTRKEPKSDYYTEMVYDIVDSVEDESIQDTSSTGKSGRRRPARGKRETRTTSTQQSVKLDSEEEISDKILDSVEDEPAIEDTPMKTRSSQGRRERTKEEESPTKRRQTPVRDSQNQNRGRTLNSEEKTASKESTPTKKKAVVDEREVACAAVSDCGEDKVGDVQPATVKNPWRGIPRKGNKAATKQAGLKDDASSKVAAEEETTCLIVDSVEDETVDKQPLNDESKNAEKPTESSETTKNEDWGKPVCQAVDSLEDDTIQEQQKNQEVSGTDRYERNDTEDKNTNDEAPAESKDTLTCSTPAVEESEQVEVKEESQCQKEEENMEMISADPSALEGAGREKRESTPTTDIQGDDKPAAESQSNTATQEEKQQEKSPQKELTVEQSSLANLDQISNENYPDDTAEEEELQEKQEATKEREKRRSRKRRDIGRRSCSDSSNEGEGKERRAKERWQENVDLDNGVQVTFDEVEADKTGEENIVKDEDGNKEITEKELMELITLNEIVEEEEETKADGSTDEAHPLDQENELTDATNLETSLTGDDMCNENEEKSAEEEAVKPSTSAKRKHDGDTEESGNFVMMGEVGETEEKEEEAVTTRTRGRLRKRTRLSPEIP
ncbi:uncharacterized protein KZ484_019561 [Pholidichthys leucotaenia]